MALKAWLDRDEKIILFDESESDKSAWCANVPVDVCRWRNEDQTVVGRGRRRTKLGKCGVEERMSNRQACERSSKDDDIERLIQSAGDIGCSRTCACVACLGGVD